MRRTSRWCASKQRNVRVCRYLSQRVTEIRLPRAWPTRDDGHGFSECREECVLLVSIESACMTHLVDRRFDVRNHWRQGKQGAIGQGLRDAFFDVP